MRACRLTTRWNSLPREVLAMTEPQRDIFWQAAMQRVRERYSWDAVTTAYEQLFESLLRGKRTA